VTELASVSAVVLVGGLGTRMRVVSGDLPKPMLPVAGRPFLEHLLRFIRRAGVRRVILATGYRAEAVRRHFGDGSIVGLELLYSPEDEPLGTGGALRLACEKTERWPVLALNGDSFFAVSLASLLTAHGLARAKLTMALVEVADTGRFGRVRTSPGGNILGFEEKSGSGPGLVNAGVYVLEKQVLAAIGPGPCSFERDALPRLLGDRTLGVPTPGLFVDIGLPDDYQRLVAAPEEFLGATSEGCC